MDSLSVLTSDELTYFKKEDRTIAVKNVRVIDDKSELKADTLIHFRKNKITYANGNVKLKSFENNTVIFGEHLEDYADKKYTLIDENPLLMQIYADVTGREMKISRSAQSCALGSATAAAVVAGAHSNFAAAQVAMCGIKDTTFKPIPENHKVYKELYALYKQLHDAFGLEDWSGKMANIMKDLLEIKDNVKF